MPDLPEAEAIKQVIELQIQGFITIEQIAELRSWAWRRLILTLLRNICPPD